MYREVLVHCPRCGVELVAGEGLRRCERCGGAWFDEGELLERLRARHPGRMLDELLEHNDGSPRRPCLVCGELMNLVWMETLSFDRCDEHGVWLEAGELERAMSYDFPLDKVKPPRDTPRRD